MKKLIFKISIVILFGLFSCLIFVYFNNIVLKSSSMEIDISEDAINYVNKLYGIYNDPIQFASYYLYYNTDYQNSVPLRVIREIKKETSTEIIVEIFDPDCQDDSIKSTKDTITLIKNGNILIPVKHILIIKYRQGYK